MKLKVSSMQFFLPINLIASVVNLYHRYLNDYCNQHSRTRNSTLQFRPSSAAPQLRCAGVQRPQRHLASAPSRPFRLKHPLKNASLRKAETRIFADLTRRSRATSRHSKFKIPKFKIPSTQNPTFAA